MTATIPSPTAHPAKFTRKIVEAINTFLPPESLVIDGFVGTGRIHWLQEYGHRTVGVEIEPEWANMHPDNIVGDALCLPFTDGTFDAYATSCTYGNRMADSHVATDASKRNTYTHVLGRKLHPNNSGGMQWGAKYKGFHVQAWMEAWRVIRPDGMFILNAKDHIRGGSRMHVTRWHIETLEEIGFVKVGYVEIPHAGNGFGRNGQERIPYESVVAFQRP